MVWAVGMAICSLCLWREMTAPVMARALICIRLRSKTAGLVTRNRQVVSSGELAAAFLLQPARLLVEVDAHDTGQQLNEENHADNAERIGNTVSDGCQWGMGAVNGNGESRRTGQGTGYQSHDTGSIDVEGIFQSHAVRAAEQMMSR